MEASMKDKIKISKKALWVIITSIVIVVVLTVGLIVFKDDLFKSEEVFQSDIVIKRTDGQQSLEMPLEYADILIKNVSFNKDYLVGLKISTGNLDLGGSTIRWGAPPDLLVNMKDEKSEGTFKLIKYCKGITDVSTISTDKKRSNITFYEGYSSDIFSAEYKGKRGGYMIIPSSISKYISKELIGEDKFLHIIMADGSSIISYEIIGEYKTKSEYDTIYLSYTGLSKQINNAKKQIDCFIQSAEIDVYEEKDLTKYIDFLGRYFADGNNLQLYEGKLNKFDEPYKYYFSHSLDMQTTPVELPIDTALSPTVNPDTNSPSVYNNELNIITISRIDGNVNLKIPHMYADELIKGYEIYKKYITDISISSETYLFKGDDGLLYWNGDYYDYRAFFTPTPVYFKSITSVSEIKKEKSDVEIILYGDYTYEDLISPEVEGNTKGSAIIPARVVEVLKEGFKDAEDVLTFTDGKTGPVLFYAEFRIIGEYITTDDSDTVYLSYSGYNEKYRDEAHKDDYLDSIVIETKKDMDISPFLEYLERFFADKTKLEKFEGRENDFSVEYEFCYDRTKATD